MKTGIAIIGSGFSGLGMAIRLKQSGIEDFVIFERAGDVGGVWRDNSYPGCGCDVESHLYSFSFAPNPNWHRMFSMQGEIWHYLQHCADQFQLRPNIRFNHEFKNAHWDDENKVWKIETSQGEFVAPILISATGAFSEPLVPEIKGLKDFKGHVFHSANWDHAYHLKGKKIAVIGTGASAIQFIPEVQPQAQSLSVFQRTGAWILPKLDRAITERERHIFKIFPFFQKLWRLRIYITREFYGLTFRHPKYIGLGRGMAMHHMKKVVKDENLRKKLTPNYTIGCKRILISNNYYPALVQKNTELITESIDHITASSIVTSDGKSREIDTIILGTGFRVTDFTIAHHVYGKSKKSLMDQWQGSPEAYLGTSVQNFPNFFFLLGPNTGLGHTSVVLMIEAQIKLVLKAVKYFRAARLREIEPKAQLEESYNKELEVASRKTVWLSGGCQSWYLDSQGRNSTLWPSSVGKFKSRILPFRKKDYLYDGEKI